MNKLLVFQSDFGLEDGAVGSMEGVAFGVSLDLNIRHLTHNIPQYNVFDASYRLLQTINYWPEDTVFVSIVDPGVGSARKSVVAKLKGNKYIVTPDNGTLTHVAEFVGIEEVREIDETVNRLKDSQQSYTFHGRDVYAYTGAKLASGIITFQQVGPQLDVHDIYKLNLYGCKILDDGVEGCVDILDIRFGSLWTSIPFDKFTQCGFEYGDDILVEIYKNNDKIYSNRIKYGKSFADVNIGEPIIYMNSVNHMAVAVNQDSFASKFNIGIGSEFKITMSK